MLAKLKLTLCDLIFMLILLDQTRHLNITFFLPINKSGTTFLKNYRFDNLLAKLLNVKHKRIKIMQSFNNITLQPLIRPSPRIIFAIHGGD